jgi:hypothetical protein
LAAAHKVPFIEASAFDGTNIDLTFHTLTENVLQKQPNKPNDLEGGDDLRKSPKKNKKKCCKQT